MNEYDYVFVGGGINALVAAAMLGKKGRTTLVLERNSAIGGCLRTEEVTAPGFLHDVTTLAELQGKLVIADAREGVSKLVTPAILVVFGVAVALGSYLSGGGQASGLGSDAIHRDGALSRIAIDNGDLWRLVTSGFIHAGLGRV